MTSQLVRGGGSEPDDDDSGCAGFSNSSSDDGADSKRSSEASDVGQYLDCHSTIILTYLVTYWNRFDNLTSRSDWPRGQNFGLGLEHLASAWPRSCYAPPQAGH